MQSREDELREQAVQECVRWALDIQITAANVVQSLVSNIMVRSVTSSTFVIDPVFDGQTFRNHPPETRARYRRHKCCAPRNLEVQLSANFLVRSRTRSTISLLMVQCQRWKCGGVLLSGGRLHERICFIFALHTKQYTEPIHIHTHTHTYT